MSRFAAIFGRLHLVGRHESSALPKAVVSALPRLGRSATSKAKWQRLSCAPRHGFAVLDILRHLFAYRPLVLARGSYIDCDRRLSLLRLV